MQRHQLISDFRSELLGKTDNPLFKQFLNALADEALIGMCEQFDQTYSNLLTPFVDADTKRRLREAIQAFNAKLKSLAKTS